MQRIIYILICFISLALGIASDFYSKSLEPTQKEISSIRNGQIVKNTIFSPHPLSIITGIFSNFFYGLSASIFIIIFIESGIDASQKKQQKQELQTIYLKLVLNTEKLQRIPLP